MSEAKFGQHENRFGFIVHPRSVSELRKMVFRYTLPILPFGPENFLKSQCLEKKIVKLMYTVPPVVSHQNISCSGKVFCIFLTPDQILNLQTTAVDLVEVACRQAQGWGSRIIGLGGLTGAIGSRGKEIAERITTPITTGNSLTVYSTLATFERLQRELDLDLSSEKIVVVGFPGSISLSIARILARKGFHLILVSRRKTPFLDRFISELRQSFTGGIEITEDLRHALNEGRIIFTATSTGQIIDPDILPTGSIVLDIAQPRDVIEKRKKRKDVLVIDGGVVTLPKDTPSRVKFSNWEPNDVPACLAETMLLALEGESESFSLGRELRLDKIEEIGQKSKNHGFIANTLRSFRKPVEEETLQVTWKAFQRGRRAT
jgi:predicted amino acid dehydrogenase